MFKCQNKSDPKPDKSGFPGTRNSNIHFLLALFKDQNKSDSRSERLEFPGTSLYLKKKIIKDCTSLLYKFLCIKSQTDIIRLYAYYK